MFIKMIIYVDILFLENLILDFIIILATEIVCNNKFKFWKTLAGSSVGSFCTVLCMIIDINKFITKILISVLIIIIVFGFRSKKYFVKTLLVFYLVSITFGGASFLLMFSINPRKIIYSAGKFLGFYPVKMAVTGGIFGFCLIFIVKKMKKASRFCNIEIGYKEKCIKVKALIDTRKFA